MIYDTTVSLEVDAASPAEAAQAIVDWLRGGDTEVWVEVRREGEWETVRVPVDEP